MNSFKVRAITVKGDTISLIGSMGDELCFTCDNEADMEYAFADIYRNFFIGYFEMAPGAELKEIVDDLLQDTGLLMENIGKSFDVDLGKVMDVDSLACEIVSCIGSVILMDIVLENDDSEDEFPSPTFSKVKPVVVGNKHAAAPVFVFEDILFNEDTIILSEQDVAFGNCQNCKVVTCESNEDKLDAFIGILEAITLGDYVIKGSMFADEVNLIANNVRRGENLSDMAIKYFMPLVFKRNCPDDYAAMLLNKKRMARSDEVLRCRLSNKKPSKIA